LTLCAISIGGDLGTGPVNVGRINVASGAAVPLVPSTVYPVSMAGCSGMAPSSAALPWTPVASGESIVFFQSNSYWAPGLPSQTLQRDSLTTLFISEAFRTGRYRNELGQAVLLTVIDLEFNTPLFFMKLYNTGVFVAAGVVAQILLDFSTLRLEFVGYIRELDPIPGPTVAMAAALAMHEMRFLNKKLRTSLAVGEKKKE